jgi:hypothetical protein
MREKSTAEVLDQALGRVSTNVVEVEVERVVSFGEGNVRAIRKDGFTTNIEVEVCEDVSNWSELADDELELGRSRSSRRVGVRLSIGSGEVKTSYRGEDGFHS